MVASNSITPEFSLFLCSKESDLCRSCNLTCYLLTQSLFLESDYRGPRASTGSIAGSVASPPPPHQRIFSHMSEEDQLQHQHHHQQHPPYPHQHQDRSNSIASGSGAMLGEEEGNHSFESNNDGNQNHQQQHQEGGVPVKKRPRRRYDEIERLYTCGWQGCAKSYGTLNHLNAHVSMQKHGEKRSPTGEFTLHIRTFIKEVRRKSREILE